MLQDGLSSTPQRRCYLDFLSFLLYQLNDAGQRTLDMRQKYYSSLSKHNLPAPNFTILARARREIYDDSVHVESSME